MPGPASRPPVASRRELATRKRAWPAALARALAAAGVRPNAVSVVSVVFAAGAALAFVSAPATPGAPRAVLFVAAAAAIQLRLLCNMLDGLLAVEQGLKSALGDLFNELPDRIADVVILAGAGYAVRDQPHLVTLGWAAAVVSVFTAYVRVFAGLLGLTQHFVGPMAKQHRMFTLTVASLGAAVEAAMALEPAAIRIGLVVIVAGAIATAVRRVHFIVAEMSTR